MTDRLETDILADLIAKKRDLLLELRAQTVRQQEVIAAGEITNLMSILAGKQTLLNQVRRVEQGLDHFRHQNPEARRWQSEEHRAKCRANAESCEQLVAELVAAEKRCEAEMIDRRDSLANQLQSAGNASNAAAAYTGHTRPASAGFDIQSEA